MKHVIEELWDFNPDETFHNTFSIDSEKGAHVVLDLTKEDMEKLTWREESGDLTNPWPHGVGKIRSLNVCKVNLTAIRKLTSEARKFRHNNKVILDDRENFVYH